MQTPSRSLGQPQDGTKEHLHLLAQEIPSAFTSKNKVKYQARTATRAVTRVCQCDGFLYFVLTSQNHSDYAAGGSIQNDSLVGPCFGNTGRLLVIILFLAPLPWYPESSCNIRMFLIKSILWTSRMILRRLRQMLWSQNGQKWRLWWSWKVRKEDLKEELLSWARASKKSVKT